MKHVWNCPDSLHWGWVIALTHVDRLIKCRVTGGGCTGVSYARPYHTGLKVVHATDDIAFPFFLVVSPFQWYIKSVLSMLLHGQNVNCRPGESVHFLAPKSLRWIMDILLFRLIDALTRLQFLWFICVKESSSCWSVSYFVLEKSSCEEYAGEFIRSHSGYLMRVLEGYQESPGPQRCEYCVYSTGDDFLKDKFHSQFDESLPALKIFGGYCLLNFALIFFFTSLKSGGLCRFNLAKHQNFLSTNRHRR